MNIKACLEAAGSSLDKVLTRRIYIIPLQDFRKVMAVWDRSVFSFRSLVRDWISCEANSVLFIDTLKLLILFLLVLG